MVVMKRFGLLAAVMVSLSSSCITVNVPIGGNDGEPVTRWFLGWARPDPSGPFLGGSIRIREFGASPDYALSAMTLRYSDGTLTEASTDRWAARLPLMLSEILARDIGASGVFASVFTYATALQDQLVVEGFVREFGAVRDPEGRWTAVLDIDVTLLDNRGTTVLLHRGYRLERTMGEAGIAGMVAQLNILGEIWSESARGDIVGALLPRR